MQIQLLLFARFRDELDRDKETLELPAAINTVEQLMAHLGERGGAWQRIFATEKVLVAVNQAVASPGYQLDDGDEVAFFPPVTGG